MYHQSNSLYNQNLCPKHIYQHASWITDNCQIQSDGVFDRVSLLRRLSEPLQTPALNDCFVCKSCSTSIALSRKSPFRIQMPIFHRPINDEIYEAKVTKLICEMTGWSIAVS